MENMGLNKGNNTEIVDDILSAYVKGLSTNSEVESIYMYTIDQSETRIGFPIIILNVIYSNESDIKKYKDIEVNTIKYGVNLATYSILKKNMDYADLINKEIKILYDKNGELKKLQEFKTNIIKSFIQQDTVDTELSSEAQTKIK